MAITNAQQYKQLVNPPMKGNKRPGYRGPGEYRGGPGGSAGKGKEDKAKSGPTNNQVDTGDLGSEEANVKTNIAANLGGSGTSDPIESVNKLQNFLNTRPTVRRLPPIGPFGIATNLFNKQFQRLSDFSTKKNRDFFKKVIGAGRLNLGGKTIDLETVGQMTPEELEKAYQDYMSARTMNEIDAYGNPITKVGDGPDEIIIPEFAEVPSITEEETLTPVQQALLERGDAVRFAAEGGIMDLDTGRQMYGLGKLVKKVTRGIKKIVKSPIGKAAMLYFAPALIPGGASTLGGV